MSSPAAAAQTPIIDCHIHLFDTSRPQGVPWPEKTNAVLFKPALPERYRSIAVPLGIVGAIKVEASPWLEDNQWVLDVAAKEPLIVGVVGNLEAGKPDFSKHLERFHKNPIFRGIRYGNLWARDLAVDMDKAGFIDDMKLVSQAGLSLDTANQTPPLIGAVVRLTDRIPDLRVVIDHLPQMAGFDDASARAHLREIGKRPKVYVKISAVFRRVDGHIPVDLGFYRDRLDAIFSTFGEDRVIFGSDWPNSDNWKPYPEVLRIVKEYFATKGQAAAEKYFWKNSVHAYRWVKRDPSQPAISG